MWLDGNTWDCNMPGAVAGMGGMGGMTGGQLGLSFSRCFPIIMGWPSLSFIMWWLESRRWKLLKARSRSHTKSFLPCPIALPAPPPQIQREGKWIHLLMGKTAYIDRKGRTCSNQLCRKSICYTYNSFRHHVFMNEEKTISTWEEVRSR